MTATHFRDHFALTDLPWFAMCDGNIITDPAVGPVVDVNTRLALAFGRRMPLDLWRTTPRTEFYCPLERSLELNASPHRNLKAGDVKRHARDTSLLTLTSRGLRVTHTAANLLRDMRHLGVALSVISPIDQPAWSHNSQAYIAAAEQSDRLLAFGSVHPFAHAMSAKLAAQQLRGARGVKLHAADQRVAPDHPRSMRLFGECAKRNMPVILDCGARTRGRRFAELARAWRPIAEHPTCTFIVARVAEEQLDAALALTHVFPNVYLELSGQALSGVRTVLARAPHQRIMFGSDWPFCSQAVALAKVLWATEGAPELRARVLWSNAATLLRLDRVDLDGRPTMVARPSLAAAAA